MAVNGFDHLNVRTPDFAATLQFLQQALGMKASPLPQFDTMETTAWVYDTRGVPILHLASADVRYAPDEDLPTPPPRSGGAIQHVALACSDYDAMVKRLEISGVAFRENAPEPGVRQVFVTDPSDIVFELNFRGQ